MTNRPAYLPKPQTLNFRHLYDASDFYSTEYSRSPAYKTGEAHAFANVLEKVKPETSTIVELMSGNVSRHREAFLQAYKIAPLTRYDVGDGGDFAADDQDLQANADFGAPGGLTLKHKYDAALAYFYSAGCVINYDDGRVTRERTVNFFRNVCDNLEPGGVFLLDSIEDAFVLSTLPDVFVSGREHYLDYSNPICERLRSHGWNITPNTSVRLETELEAQYERRTGNYMERHTRAEVYVKVNDEYVLALSYTFELPMCMRWFSEIELSEMLREAGFSTVDYWYADYVTHDIYQHDAILTYEEDAGDDARLAALTNLYVARKPL